MQKKDLAGRTVLITGGNSGIGFEAAKQLVSRGAEMILAVRNIDKGGLAANRLRAQDPEATVHVKRLDLADLRSVQEFAAEITEQFTQLNVHINNAGVMMPPYSKTKDGFEMQFGSNHLGHFALTAHLLPLIEKTPSARIVTVASLAHNRGMIDFANLDGSNGYQAKKFYNQSKLANLLFALELDRRLKRTGCGTLSVACHPGISATNIFKLGKRDAPLVLRQFANRFLQPPEIGAMATVHAATEPSLSGGEYIGPDGKNSRKGFPVLETPHPAALDEEIAVRLWEVSEQLTGVQYPFS